MEALNCTQPCSIGHVNIIFNRTYGSIFDFFPKKKQIFCREKKIYNSGLNSNKVEKAYLNSFFGLNKHLSVNGYTDTNESIYFVSKLLNNQLTILTYNLYMYMAMDTAIEEITSFIKILKKNAPNCPVGFVIRGLNFLDSDEKREEFQNKVNNLIRSCYSSNLFGIYFTRFEFMHNDEIQKETQECVHRIIENYFYQHPEQLIKFDDGEAKTLNMFFFMDSEYSSIYSRTFFKKYYKDFVSDVDVFIQKLVDSGILMNFPNTAIKDLYFYLDGTAKSIVWILLKIIGSYAATTYRRKKSSAPYGWNSYTLEKRIMDFRCIHDFIPWSIKKTIKNFDRLILILLRELNVGRKFGKKYIYIRKYGYNELTKSQHLAFIY